MMEGLPSEAEELGSHPESDLSAGAGLCDLLALLSGCDCLRHMAKLIGDYNNRIIIFIKRRGNAHTNNSWGKVTLFLFVVFGVSRNIINNKRFRQRWQEAF